MKDFEKEFDKDQTRSVNQKLCIVLVGTIAGFIANHFAANAATKIVDKRNEK